jgi:hypothetical protein
MVGEMRDEDFERKFCSSRTPGEGKRWGHKALAGLV